MVDEKVNENNNLSENVQDTVESNNEERMLERWTYTVNGYTFAVKPILLGEERNFLDDLKASPVPSQIIETGVMPTDKELSRWAITLFSDALNDQFRSENKKNILGIIKNFIFSKIIRKKNHTYYVGFPAAQPAIKWFERKFYYKGNPVLFYDLERKFQLNKVEIEKMFIFLYQISGF